jgi:hypothetical protein
MEKENQHGKSANERRRLAGLSMSEESASNCACVTSRETSVENTSTSAIEVEIVLQHNETWDKFQVKYTGYTLGGGDIRDLWRTFDELKMACPEHLYDYMMCPAPGMLRPMSKNNPAHIKMLRTLQRPCPLEKMEEVKDRMRIEYEDESEDISPLMLHRQDTITYCCNGCANGTSNDCGTCAHCHNVECDTHQRYYASKE